MAQKVDGSKARILVVDDEPSLVNIMETILRRHGYEVDTAPSGESAVAGFRENPTDLVITDIRMPGMGGLDVLEAVKKIDPNVPVIVLTGHATLDVAISALKDHGAFDFLTKPQNTDNMLRAVAKALEYGALLRHNAKLMETLRKRQSELEEQNQTLRIFQRDLETSRQRYQDLYDNAPVGYLTVDSNGLIVEANAVAAQILGKPLGALINQSFESLIDPADLQTYQDCQCGIAENDAYSCELVMLQPEKKQFHAQVEAKAIRSKDHGISQIRIIITDITRYKILQSKIMESRRLDAIANLAGGVAHQFNNALAGLVGYIELLKMDMNQNDRKSSHFETVFDQIERMAHLTQQLLAYAKGGQYAPADISLADFVDSTLSLIRSRVPERIRLETDLPTDTGHVRADSTQLQMVLLALVENASEAIRDKGRIRIATRNVRFTPEQIELNPKRLEGAFVRLVISDEGCGMDEATLKKAFDPFFTTKFIGRGLGLSAVYGIIDNHGGWLEIDSEVGKGTEVRIHLPAVEVKARRKAPKNRPAITGEGATVLVVDDEEQLMRATCQRLARLNFRILEAGTGRAALDLIASHSEAIDVVLLDMRLPDIDGERLFHEMRALRPDLKIVLCSGYAIDEPVTRLLEQGAHGFLQKPFSLATLSEKLKTTISAAKSSGKDKQGRRAK
ncbi:MAG: response regulator [Desulfosarcinaceae bacterium]